MSRFIRVLATQGLAVGVLALGTACDALVTRPSLYGNVAVAVVRRNGDAIPGTRLILYTGQRHMGYGVTDAAGHYAFTNVPEGAYGVRATPPSGYVRIDSLVPVAPMDWVDKLSVNPGLATDVRLGFLKYGNGSVTVEITEPGGKPVAEVPLFLYGAMGIVRSANSDAMGRLAFDSIPLGNYGVFARRPAAYIDIGEDPLVFRDGLLIEEGSRERVTMTFEKCSGSVRVTVMDDTARPVPGAPLTLYDAMGILAEDSTGAGGTTTFPAPGCGNLGVRVRPPIGWTVTEGPGTSFVDGLFVRRGSALTATLRLQFVTCRATLRIAVNDDHGAAVGGARLVLYIANVVYRDLLSPASGQVIFDDIPCDREYGVMIFPPSAFTVAEGRGSSFFDGLRFADGSVVDRAFILVRR